MQLYISNEANANYLSRIVKIDNIRKHANADKLQITAIDGANIIVGLDVQIGDILVFCPTESCLNSDFLLVNNLYENKEMNKNKEAKGYVNSKGRVRTIKLRGEYSRAFLFPVANLAHWISEFDASKAEEFVGTEFDTVCDQKFSWKYVPLSRKKSLGTGQVKKKESDNIVEGQFNFHKDTAQFAKNIGQFSLTDTISISHKLHGTSGIAAYLKTHKQMNWFKQILCELMGEKPTEYAYIASSRKAIRSVGSMKDKDLYCDTNVWTLALEELKPYLQKGMTLYFEIVGYIPTSKGMIQKGYDYGCEQGKFAIHIYRITHTNDDGVVYEFSTQQVKHWCSSNGLNMVPELYYGDLSTFLFEAASAVSAIDLDCLLPYMQTFAYMEKDDPLCKNKVPFEGLVIRKCNTLEFEAYKLKANKFYAYETKMLDQDDVGVDGDEE